MDAVASVILDSAIFGFASLGVACTVVWGRAADLTPDAAFTAGAVAAWLSVGSGFSGIALVLAGFVGGAGTGAATYFVTRLGVQPLLSSLVVLGLSYSALWTLMQGPLRTIPATASFLSANSDPTDAAIVLAAVLTVAAGMVAAANSRVGLILRAAAENAHAAPGGKRWAAAASFAFLVLGNGLVGASGALFASRSYFVEINMGVGTLIAGLSAVLLGWAFLGFDARPARLICGALIGALLLRTLLYAAFSLGVPAPSFRAVSAVALLLCLLLATGARRRVLRDLKL